MSTSGNVNFSVHNVPAELLEEFDQAIASIYPGGRSEAIRDLIRKFVKDRTNTEA